MVWNRKITNAHLYLTSIYVFRVLLSIHLLNFCKALNKKLKLCAIHQNSSWEQKKMNSFFWTSKNVNRIIFWVKNLFLKKESQPLLSFFLFPPFKKWLLTNTVLLTTVLKKNTKLVNKLKLHLFTSSNLSKKPNYMLLLWHLKILLVEVKVLK